MMEVMLGKFDLNHEFDEFLESLLVRLVWYYGKVNMLLLCWCRV